MRSLCSGGLRLSLAIISIIAFNGCGGHRPAGASTFPARINLTPGISTSVQLGNTFVFTAAAQNDVGSTLNLGFTYSSDNTSIVNIASNGVACAGVWNVNFTICTPGGAGVAKVTASALGISSPPTYVFVHPAIDNITVSGVLLNGLPIQEPCLSQGQSMTVQAQAFSQGVDITSSVGPFTWSSMNTNVVLLTPIVNLLYNLPTNQATATANSPGLTQIFASASGVTSTSFTQPLLTSKPVVFDFFESCPIQNITLGVGPAGVGQPSQTSFITSKGTAENINAVVTDVMGNSSLPNKSNGIVLSKTPLTWTATRPSVVSVAAGCTETCSASTPSPGAGAVSASCSPPTCNIGYPQSPAVLSSALCTQYYPPTCQQFIPLPVYATTAISGVVTGTPAPSTVVATSLGCSLQSPALCASAMYSLTTSKAQSGGPNEMPTNPNSLLFDLAGDKIYMGSKFGAQLINPTNLNTSNSAFTPLGSVTGKILAVSPNGGLGIFSDTDHAPNQVYVVNTTTSTALSAIVLNIAGSTAAAFSPDGSKAFIFGYDGSGNPNLYVYSTLQSVQVIALPPQTTVNSIAFSTNGAFVYVAEPSMGGAGPAVSVFNSCDNDLFTDTTTNLHYIPLNSPPVAFRALPDGVHFVSLENDGNLEYISATITGIPAATLSHPATSICPMTVGHTVQSVDLQQGTIQPINFFTSADGTLLYVVASDRGSVLVYNFATSSTGGIQLVNTGTGDVSPLGADITTDASTILVAGSDNMLHEVTTGQGGSDQFQVAFPNLPNVLNPFCTEGTTQGSCKFDGVAAKP
jgi:hypothetical protein